MALRMLGLFAFIPVASLLIGDFPGASTQTAGLAMGLYGLTQSLSQIPFGFLSDRFGRKRIMLVGILLFVIGSIVSALATQMWVMALGRAIQGCGAIGAVLMAMVSDVTRLEVRTKAMAFVGLTMGGSFFIALLVGPLVVSAVGFSGLFWGMTFLGLGSFGLCWRALPTLERETPLSLKENLKTVLDKRAVWFICVSVALLHMILSAVFLILPSSLLEIAQLEKSEAWQVYVPALVLSVIIMMPMARRSQNRSKILNIVKLSIPCMAIGLAGLSWVASYSELLLVMTLYFIGFNLLEALLPALLSELVTKARGSAMGLYGSFQFMGIFLGGALGGYTWELWGAHGVYYATSVVCVFWWGSLVLGQSWLRFLDRESSI